MTSLLDLRRLRYFVAVAEEGHFGRAAKRLRISQPPLSVQIQVLERELRSKLLERTRHTTHLTPAGRILLDRARRILADVEDLRTEVGSAAVGTGGDLRFGFVHSAGLMPFFGRTLRAFQARAPGVRLKARAMPSGGLLDALGARDLDLILVRYPSAQHRRSFETNLLCTDRFVVAMPEDDALVGKASVRAGQLENRRFIGYALNTGIGLTRTVLGLMGEANLYPEIAQEARDYSELVGMVGAGLGVGIVPASLSCLRAEGVVFIRLADAAARSGIFVAKRRAEQDERVLLMERMLLAEARSAARARLTANDT